MCIIENLYHIFQKDLVHRLATRAIVPIPRTYNTKQSQDRLYLSSSFVARLQLGKNTQDLSPRAWIVYPWLQLNDVSAVPLIRAGDRVDHYDQRAR